MSYILDSIKQVRFLVYDCAYGMAQIVINRPGNPSLTQAASDTLILSAETDVANGDYSPFLESEIPLSKKFITTKGRRALDDITIAMRDSLGYSGTVDGVATAEHFSNGTSTSGPQAPEYKTFFNVWFSDAEKYPCWVLYQDAVTGGTDVCGGWIDPAYKPINNPFLINPGTAQQIFLGTRTIKIVNLNLATWADVLALITEADTKSGTPYLGFMQAPPGCQGKTDSRDHIFPGSTSSKGSWYLAVPHAHIHNGGDPRVLRCIDDSIWPFAPFTGQGAGSIWGATVYNHSTWMPFASHGYGDNDTGTVLGGVTNGKYKIPHFNLIINGAPAVYITDGGQGYSVGQICNTTVTTGTGDGTLQLLVEGLGSFASWGPSGFVFISLGTLFAKIAEAQGLAVFTPSADLKSALSWWAQKADNANKCFPIDTSTEIPLEEIYVSLNVLARSHPADGSLWNNPIGPAPTAPITDVLTSLCNLLLSDYNFPFAPDGVSSIALKAMGSNTTTIPPEWVCVGVPDQAEPSTLPRSATVHNRGDDLKIQAPFGAIGDSSDIDVPLRIKSIGTTFSRSNSDKSVDNAALQFDSKLGASEQADKCLMVFWEDDAHNKVINPDLWKSLCYLFWLDETNPAHSPVYPTNWNPFPKSDGTDGTWQNSFYVINAVYKGGATPDADLMNELRGSEYFNTRNYHAVAFGTLSVDLPTVQSLSYAGVSDSTGSVQNIGTGMSGSWCYEGDGTQNWRALELTQGLVSGITDIKWQAESTSGAFPNLTDLTASQVEGGSGTSSSGSGSTASGGVPGGTSGGSHFQFDSVVTLTGVTPQIATKDILYLCSDAATTGVTAPSTLEAGTTFGLKNNTPNDWTSSGGGDFYVPSGAFWLLIYHGATGHTDATLPEGWSAIRDQ